MLRLLPTLPGMWPSASPSLSFLTCEARIRHPQAVSQGCHGDPWGTSWPADGYLGPGPHVPLREETTGLSLQQHCPRGHPRQVACSLHTLPLPRAHLAVCPSAKSRALCLLCKVHSMLFIPPQREISHETCPVSLTHVLVCPSTCRAPPQGDATCPLDPTPSELSNQEQGMPGPP